MQQKAFAAPVRLCFCNVPMKCHPEWQCLRVTEGKQTGWIKNSRGPVKISDSSFQSQIITRSILILPSWSHPWVTKNMILFDIMWLILGRRKNLPNINFLVTHLVQKLFLADITLWWKGHSSQILFPYSLLKTGYCCFAHPLPSLVPPLPCLDWSYRVCPDDIPVLLLGHTTTIPLHAFFHLTLSLTSRSLLSPTTFLPPLQVFLHWDISIFWECIENSLFTSTFLIFGVVLRNLSARKCYKTQITTGNKNLPNCHAFVLSPLQSKTRQQT